MSKCKHKWLDTDIPYVDIVGGFHTCILCKEEIYIHWGKEWRSLVEEGSVVNNWQGTLMKDSASYKQIKEM